MINTKDFFSNFAAQNPLINNSKNAIGVLPSYQDEEMVTFTSDSSSILNQSSSLNIIKNFTRKDVQQEFPTINVETQRPNQELHFNFTTKGWTKPSEFLVNFCLNLNQQARAINATISTFDQPNASTKLQSAFAFLNSLESYTGYIGEKDVNQTTDYSINYDRKATKAIMCVRPRTQLEHIMALNAGLPCQKSNIIANFEDENYAKVYDKKWYQSFARQKVRSSNGNDLFKYNCTLYLKEFFPWLEADDMLFPPGIQFTFRFRFNYVDTFRASTTSNRFANIMSTPLGEQSSNLRINGNDTSAPLTVVNSSSQYILYNQYSPIEKFTNDLKKFTRYTFNTWVYELYQKVYANQQTPIIQLSLLMKAMPSRLIIYFTLPEERSIYSNQKFSTNNGQLNFLQNDGTGFLVGYRITDIKISANGNELYSIENNAVANNLPATTLNVFEQNRSAWDAYMNLQNFKNCEMGKSILVSQKLNTQIDNFVPHTFNLSPELLNKKNIRPIVNEDVNLDIQLTFNHLFYHKTNISNNPTTCSSVLPPDTTINCLLEYGNQYILDKNLNFSYVQAPNFLIGEAVENTIKF